MDNLIIRRIQSKDWEEIASIYAAITQKGVKDEFKRIVKDCAESETDASFVAELDGQVIGYMIGMILSGGFGIQKGAWITMLGVNPQFMGQGIGKSLAQAFFKVSHSNGINNIYTSVRWDSTDLLSFFKDLGFNRSEFINLTKVID